MLNIAYNAVTKPDAAAIGAYVPIVIDESKSKFLAMRVLDITLVAAIPGVANAVYPLYTPSRCAITSVFIPQETATILATAVGAAVTTLRFVVSAAAATAGVLTLAVGVNNVTNAIPAGTVLRVILFETAA